MNGAWQAVLVMAVLLLHAQIALADPDARRRAAREHFDRGLALFEQRDDGGAAAEFERAYALVPHPQVLYNLALVYAAMQRPVDAVDAFDRLVAEPKGLSPDKLAHAGKVRAEQAARIGLLSVECNVPAAIEIGGIKVADVPRAQPIRIGSGVWVVGAVAPGYVPERREVSIAGGARASVRFTLARSEQQLAHLRVTAKVPNAAVVVDGVVVGKTPLVAPLALAPGQHTVRLRRAGYFGSEQRVRLDPGASGDVDLALRVDPASLTREGGVLRVDVSESEAVLFVNGQHLGAVSTLRLPHGRHVVRVERAGFFPAEREVEVPRGGRVDVRVDLEPTAEKRAAYVASARSTRTWGWVSLVGGGVVTAASGGFLLWNRGRENDAKAEFESAFERVERKECDSLTGDDQAACLAGPSAKLATLEDVRARYPFGFVGLGVGVVGLGIGTFLLVSGDDPDRYEPRAESDVFGRLRLRPRLTLTPGAAALSVQGAF